MTTRSNSILGTWYVTLSVEPIGQKFLSSVVYTSYNKVAIYNIWGSHSQLLNVLVKMSLATDNICFAWTGDFDSLKVLVAKDLELSGIWEHPGGDKKLFKFNNSSIS